MRLYFSVSAPGGFSCVISVLSRSKQSVSCGLSLCGWPALCGHWHSAYAYGNRERSYDDAYVVGMYVS